MSTLTDFLLARIAEDEEVVKEAHMPDFRGEAPRFYDSPGAHRDDWGPYTFHVEPDRVLAECEAKRQIVALYQQFCHPEGLMDRVAYPSVRATIAACLRHLAAVYTDHPDYRPEWRP